MKFRSIFLIAVLTLFTSQAFTQKSKVDLKKLDKYYEQVVKEWGIPGMTVGIVKDGELIFSKGYGVKEEGKNDKPDGNTLYAIASNSKAFTSAIMAQLVQEGKLKWDDKVRDHLPYFALYDDYAAENATIRDILSHRIGLGTFSGDAIWYQSDLTSEEIIKRIKFIEPAYEFRAGYGYSNLMYITAGEIIKTITGKSWSQNVKERFLDPLGMSRTITQLAKLDEVGNYATPHRLEEGKNIPIGWVNWEEIAATGGLISSVEDMAKWMIFNLNNGIHHGDTLLTPASRNMVWMPHNNFYMNHTKPNDTETHFRSYGLGWSLSDYRGRMLVAHTGGYDGFITAVNLMPDEKLGVVVLTNGTKSPIGAVSRYTLDAFTGGNKKDWSADYLKRVEANKARDTRIADRKAARVTGTEPFLPLEAYTGTYYTDTYGNITVAREGDKLTLNFEHSPALNAKLAHWHYNIWEIKWNEPSAWFSFGTIQFTLDNNLNVTGIEFDVPNDDFWFEELNAKRVK